MTYRQLKIAIEQLTEDQLDMDVTVSAGDGEYFHADACDLAMNEDEADGVLDPTQPIILFRYSL